MLDLMTQKPEAKVSTLPKALAQTLKGGETFTAKGPGIMIFFPAPDDWAENSDGYKTLFGKHYGPLINGDKHLVAAGAELSMSAAIYRKIPKSKAERLALMASRSAVVQGAESIVR